MDKYGPIEVFRAGKFVAMGGSEQTISEVNLRDIASGYDRDLSPAPVVIGHPATDTPAFGWVEHLYVEGGILKATLEETSVEFASLVKEGRYKRVSIALFLPNSPNNPKPGNFYLKHVGFLGAASPAVPGLKPVKFVGGSSEILTLDQDKNDPAQFASNEELTRLRAMVREQEVEKLIGEGRVLPVFKTEVLAFAASLDDRETVSFSDGGDALTRKDWFMGYLARQPKVVTFGEMGLDDRKIDGPRRKTHNVPDGYSVDRTNDDLFFSAQQVARNKGVSFGEAVDLVLAGGA